MESLEQKVARLEKTIIAIQETNSSLKDLLRLMNDTLNLHAQRIETVEDSNLAMADLLNEIFEKINTL